jgi:hypothetical protein
MDDHMLTMAKMRAAELIREAARIRPTAAGR